MNNAEIERYLVIFDCDGVLVDSEPTSNRVLAEAITDAGLSIGPDEVALTFEGMRLSDIQTEIEKRLGGSCRKVGSPASRRIVPQHSRRN